MRPLLALSACLTVLAASPSLAQDSSSYELFPFTRQRATNVARMYAERLNGGLNLYRPDNCMYNRAAGDCLVKGDAQGYIFRFRGGAPGWQLLNLPAKVETEIEISPDGRSVVQVIYNGAPRAAAPIPGTTPAPIPGTTPAPIPAPTPGTGAAPAPDPAKPPL